MPLTMKIERKWLMACALFAGASIILYTIVREIFGFSLGERFEKTFFDLIFVIAIALVVLNRKLASDEKKAEKENGGTGK